MARVIQGWQTGQLVAQVDMADFTAITQTNSWSSPADYLPCIYNGLTFNSFNSGTNILTLNPGVARCQDLLTSTYTYLPTNTYEAQYPCYIDINSNIDNNNTVLLSTGIASGYVVATFGISPTAPNAYQYTITGLLSHIATGSYNPAIHVKICLITYSGSFSFDFTPFTNRDYDLNIYQGLQPVFSNSGSTLNQINSNVSFNANGKLVGYKSLSSDIGSGFIGELKQIFTGGPTVISANVSYQVILTLTALPPGYWILTGMFTGSATSIGVGTQAECTLFISENSGSSTADLALSLNALSFLVDTTIQTSVTIAGLYYNVSSAFSSGIPVYLKMNTGIANLSGHFSLQALRIA